MSLMKVDVTKEINIHNIQTNWLLLNTQYKHLLNTGHLKFTYFLLFCGIWFVRFFPRKPYRTEETYDFRYAHMPSYDLNIQTTNKCINLSTGVNYNSPFPIPPSTNEGNTLEYDTTSVVAGSCTLIWLKSLFTHRKSAQTPYRPFLYRDNLFKVLLTCCKDFK